MSTTVDIRRLKVKAKFNRANKLQFKCEGLLVTKQGQSYTEKEK